METRKPQLSKAEATQLPLTPKAANPPEEKVAERPDIKTRYVIPETILPPEEKPIETTEDRREKYLRGDY